MFFAFRIGAGLGLCKSRNDDEAEDAKSKGGIGRPVRPYMRRGLDARSRMKNIHMTLRRRRTLLLLYSLEFFKIKSASSRYHLSCNDVIKMF